MAHDEGLLERCRDALRALPGVESEAMGMQMPYSGNSASTLAAPPGYVPRPDESMDVEWRVVTPSFFETLGIRLLAGLGHHEELALHIKATANTGASADDIREALLHVAIYAGVPAANHAIKIVKQVFAEMDAGTAAR